MKENFSECLALVLQHEGGFVNHPKDPGGATMKGVTQAVYDDFRVKRNLAKQSVLHISQDEIGQIYKRQYWDAVAGDKLPSGVDYATFDLAVNSGVGRAARFLQSVLDVPQDGMIGAKTIAAITNPETTAGDLCAKRMAFLQTLGTFSTFGKGWTARVKAVSAKAQEMAA